MARFKFGKKKKDGSIDPNTSIDDDSAASIDASQELTPGYDNHLPTPSQGDASGPVYHSPILKKSPLAGATTTSSPPLDPEGTPWTKFKLRNSPFPRYRHSASSISSEKNEVFLMGGLKEGSVFGDTWKIVPTVDPSTNSTIEYTAEPVVIANNNNPPARVGHSSVLIGNAFIIYGGDTVDTDFNGFPDNNFYLFNINNNKYTIPSHILNKPNGRYGHTIGVVSLNNQSSRLYLFGGQLENDVFNDLYYFELNTFKSPKARWNLVEPLNNFRPPPLTNHTMSVYKNQIYVFGGVYNNEKVSNDLWCFDIASSKWTQISSSGNTPLPVNEHSACIIHDKLYVYGGNDFSGIIYNSLYVLDLHTLVWSKLISNGEIDGPGSRCGHTMTYLPALNKILIMGGDKNDYASSDPNDFNTYETKDPAADLDTIIYQLDLSVLDSFLSSRQTVVKATKKAAAAAGLSDTVVRSSTTSPLGSNSATPFGGVATVGAVGTAGVVGAVAATGMGHSSSQEDEVRQGFQRHARSFSAGPEEFRTPAASPERPRDVIDNGDKFVEVPSTAISERGDITEDDIDVSRFSNSGTNDFSNTNGHTKAIETDRLVNSSTPNLAKNVENEKVKQLVAELTSQLTALRQNAKIEMQNATEKINALEHENTALRSTNAEDLKLQLQEKDDVIRELKQQIDPNLLKIDEENEERDVASNITNNSNSVGELTRYKLERLELNNKLIYLTQENSVLNNKIQEFEPFMNNQVAQLSDFQKIIAKQEEKVKILTQQVRDQEILHKEINNWKSKHDNLELEYNNYRSIHDNDDISDDEPEQEDVRSINGVDSTNKSILSNSTTRRSKKDISNQLEHLVNAWNTRNISSASTDRSVNNAVDPMVLELQKQLDGLMKISKEQEVTSAREISTLRSELDVKLSNLRTYDSNYKDALQSVNNTSKALKLTQEELNNQRSLMEKLIKENNELKLFKKASKRTSTRNPLQFPSQENVNIANPIREAENEEDDDALENAHYNMKLKDLEADLFILKQERDQLKDNVTSLQKQLYLAHNST
ncbi:Negative regulator of mitotic exit [Yamadazyma tenuis]|uniref:Galactose oxidase n=1 Tax=Candida tenuis (strain ATCC 10573 / BCRC 21748 / CBS 615 / JCM 9827 / NBRC 10315 / NRRL Y-1498 / VKM Y-70) TaxID=590646 RepID=G3B727_CANTC|nr:uncharacterized protein CANTEDRAFT_93853 [Yamadazyma tenuis ATCC 10573]EGV63081.1 hypothetical protein CANTEDRAFT_93853 [Yamadazyma tenuis ATCC 10573]WEJ97102.1 Negative regulator of mitotic exit [Yamadazyma tenuis]